MSSWTPNMRTSGRADAEPVPFATSLFVQTMVISANHPGLATTDAGLKAFATDAGPPLIVAGAPEGTSYVLGSDEQGRLELGPGNALAPGAVITCAVPHCDPDGQSLRSLPRRQRRHLDRHLAGRRPRPLAMRLGRGTRWLPRVASGRARSPRGELGLARRIRQGEMQVLDGPCPGLALRPALAVRRIISNC